MSDKQILRIVLLFVFAISAGLLYSSLWAFLAAATLTLIIWDGNV